MKIEAIELHRVAMPVIYPFRTAYGDGHVIESVLVRMSAEGVDGWGETTPWESPLYSPEWAGGVFALIRDWLAPRLLGREIDSGEALQQQLAPFKANPFAKAGLDLAWWDLEAKRHEMPLWQLLGGRGDTIEVGADFGVMDTIPELLDTIGGAVEAGFPRVKLKFRPGWDVEMVGSVREAFPELVMHVDCNSGYRLEDLPVFQALDSLGLAMIEQPLRHDDLLDHAELQRQLKTPLCLDESIVSLERTRQAIDLGACGWINLKPARVGGLTPAVQILREAEKGGIPCWVGGMLESAVGACHCIALATLPNIGYPADIFPSSRFYRKDLSVPEIQLSAPGRIRALPGPGIGCVPDRGELERLVVESHRLG